MKRWILIAWMAVIAGCGGGGQDVESNTTSTASPPPATTAPQKTSIADGTWKIISDGTWRDPLNTPPPPSGNDPFYLGIFYYIKFENGAIRGTTSTGDVATKYGPFTVNNGSLDYTFTNLEAFQPVYSTNPITGKSELTYNQITRVINEHVTVNITVSGNTMTWQDSSGNIATFTK